MSKANLKKGLVIVNTGDGKGKTTAALGMVLRAWRRGFRICVIQFLKPRTCDDEIQIDEFGACPSYQMGRVYRDALGWVNQTLARTADKVIFMVAGIPAVIK